MPYKKNYLAQVIFQLRFDSVLSLAKDAPAKFQEETRDLLPNVVEGQEVQVIARLSPGPEMSTDVQQVRPRWVFSAKNKSRSLAVSSTMFSLEYAKYESIDATRRDLDFLWGKFRSLYPIETLNRVGLRYIDKIARPEGDPLDWKGWIADELLAGTFALDPPSEHMWSRSMHALHWTGDGHRITFQFGIFNGDDFPNPVAKKEFILDSDCSSIGPVDADEAANCLVKYHNLLHVLFERSIGDNMRADMNAGDGPAGTEEGGA